MPVCMFALSDWPQRRSTTVWSIMSDTPRPSNGSASPSLHLTLSTLQQTWIDLWGCCGSVLLYCVGLDWFGLDRIGSDWIEWDGVSRTWLSLLDSHTTSKVGNPKQRQLPAFKKTTQNTQEVKNSNGRFLIGQHKIVCKFSANIVFNKATNRQIYIARKRWKCVNITECK